MTQKNYHLNNAFGGKKGIPPGFGKESTFSVVLLHSNTMKTSMRNLKGSLPRAMTKEELDSVELALQDIAT